MRRLAILAALLALASGGGATASSAGVGLAFPRGTPAWLAASVTRTAQGADGGKATLVDIRLGRFPIVVLRGDFHCDCSAPGSAGTMPTLHFVTTRYDAVTKRATDVGMSVRSPGRISPTCDRTCRVYRAARSAQDALGHRVHVGRHQGSHRCSAGPIRATCKLSIGFARTRTVVTVRMRWPVARSAATPVLTHVWRVEQTPQGWVTSVASSGDPLPR